MCGKSVPPQTITSPELKPTFLRAALPKPKLVLAIDASSKSDRLLFFAKYVLLAKVPRSVTEVFIASVITFNVSGAIGKSVIVPPVT